MSGAALAPAALQRLFTSGDGRLAHLLGANLNQVLEAQMAERLIALGFERTAERQGRGKVTSRAG